MSNETDRIKTIKIHVAKEAGPTFCLAKWHHVTMYLQSGETHSCYHPRPHKIPLHELANNPSALHNTNEKKLERKMMLEGGKPSGCQYCWSVEALGDDYISDRHQRNASIFNEQRFNQCAKGEWTQNINPEYIEINFGNECNFKCGYCHPKYSTSYYNEVKKWGPVTTVKNHRGDIDYLRLYQREDDNPYVDAWWRWWPEMKNTLQILRVTGGEPTMHTSTWKLFEELEREPLPHLELNINSNLGTKTALIQKMSDAVLKLTTTNKIKTFKLFTSLDTWGSRAEYIRTGLDLQLWEHNFHTYLQSSGSPVTFMITFNALCVTTFKTFLEKLLEWRKQYGWYENKHSDRHRVRFDTPYLREPLQYDMNILPKDVYMPYMQQALQFMQDNTDDSRPDAFTTLEYEKFRRVVDYMANTHYSDEKLREGRSDFYNWFRAMDERRGTNFVETFPEMTDFYSLCQSVANNRK